jgi:hypothetical protein
MMKPLLLGVDWEKDAGADKIRKQGYLATQSPQERRRLLGETSGADGERKQHRVR